ncbi:SIMPL domain-containing protein [Phenylobacterium sp.]|jgi:hypothetical protein|uniref:SIMPL domain-containing protein n=1 Tax=Phenylobacterium sp. TaxID=1871053 RepID=UPI002F3F2809
MRLILAAVLVTALAAPALAAAPLPVAPPPNAPRPAPRAYDLAPWWMDKPVIPAIGYVTTEVPANRASLSATYDAVDREVADATKAAALKAKAISGALQAFGADKVRVETRFSVTPLYEQYREKNGAMVDNQRADKIDRYQVSIQFAVEIRDMRLVEPVYAILMSAKPSQSSSPNFRLEASDEVRTEMFKLAVEDARKRAEQAASAAGTKVGAVRLIDPTARGCETDELLALAERGDDQTAPVPVAAPPAAFQARSSISQLIVTASKRAVDAGLRPEDLQLPVEPPMERLTGKACVIYSLG